MAEPADKHHKPDLAVPQPSQPQEEFIAQESAHAGIFRQFSSAATPPLKPSTILRLQATIGNAATDI